MTYPNVLVMGYLEATGQLTPERRMKLEHAIHDGAQRLLTFEAPGGGFEWYGRSPGHVMLTAYGLLELSDMARVHPVDPKFIDRIAGWLLRQQRTDGTFPAEGGPRGWTEKDPDGVAATAYVAWSLLQSGRRQEAETSIRWLRERVESARDPYVLALVANALASYHPEQDYTRDALERLGALARRDASGVHWTGEMAGFTGARGGALAVETTALAVIALLQGRGDPALTDGALEWLLRRRDEAGTWGSTQATILAIKALLDSARKGDSVVRGTLRVQVALEDGSSETLTFEEGKTDTVQQAFFAARGRPGKNRVRLEADADAGIGWQVVGRAWTPGREEPPAEGPLALRMTLDRTTLATDETVRAEVEVSTRDVDPTFMVIADLGIPPGFSPVTSDLEDLVTRGVVDKFTIAGRRVTLYLGTLTSGAPIRFSYRLQARMPVKAAMPPAEAYEYYTPDRRARAIGLPVSIEVR